MDEPKIAFVRWSAESELKAIADRLLGSIPEDVEEVPSLKPVAVVFLSAVLEALSIYAVDLLAAQGSYDRHYASAASKLRGLPLRERLRQLPIAATKSTFALNVKGESVKNLFALVARRNAIVHIKPEIHLVPLPATEEALSRLDKPVVTDELLDLVRGPSLDRLRQYREAIEQFEAQFVDRIGPGDYKCGDILTEGSDSPGKTGGKGGRPIGGGMDG